MPKGVASQSRPRDCAPCVCFFSSRRRHTRFDCDWSSDVCSSDLDSVKPSDAMTGPLAYARLHGRNYEKWFAHRSEEHTSELQSQSNLVCRLLLEKKNGDDLLFVRSDAVEAASAMVEPILGNAATL